MTRKPLYQAEKLIIDFQESRNCYILKKNDNPTGTFYKTDKQVASLAKSLEKSINENPLFKNIKLIITSEAQKRINIYNTNLSSLKNTRTNFNQFF